MSTIQTRQPRGTASGGQWAAGAHAEGDLDEPLMPSIDEQRAQLAADYEAWRAERSLLVDHLGASNEASRALRQRAGEQEWLRLTQSDIDDGVPSLAVPEPAVRPVDVADADGVWDARSSFVQGGGVADKVRVTDEHGHQTLYQRRRYGVYPDYPYAMRFQANRPISDAEMHRAAQLVGYAYRSTVNGESIGSPVRDSPFSFAISTDTTKSRHDDVGDALANFEDRLPAMLIEGSPVRSTNRAGAGTQGTRLVDGIGDQDLSLGVYYDSVYEVDHGTTEDAEA